MIWRADCSNLTIPIEQDPGHQHSLHHLAHCHLQLENPVKKIPDMKTDVMFDLNDILLNCKQIHVSMLKNYISEPIKLISVFVYKENQAFMMKILVAYYEPPTNTTFCNT